MMVVTSMTDSQTADTAEEIVVYWRPGCGFCSALRSQLDKAEVPHRLVNIWDTPDAAATVRSIANGNETVPTVQIGPVGLVNPTLKEVLVAASVHAPSAMPEGYEAPEPGPVSKFVGKLLGGSD